MKEHTELWAAVQVDCDPEWELLLEVPDTVLIFCKRNDLVMELKKWHYLVVGNEVFASPKTLVAHIRQVSEDGLGFLPLDKSQSCATV